MWAYSTTSVTSAQDSKGNALVSGAFYRILLPSRAGSVALKQNGEYVQAYNGYGIIGYMWKIEEDANGKALISNPAGGYWKFTDYDQGNSKLKTNGTSSDCTAFQMAWVSSGNKTLNLFDPNGGTYSYGGVKCGAVLSNHGGVGKNMGIYNDILDGGSIFKFERFYQTVFTIASTDVNGVAVENYPATVTVDGNKVSEYYTNSDNQITSFSTEYGAAYYIGGVEKTAEEVKAAINANTGTLTVTVKPKPFVASTNDSHAYYALMISGNANSWWQNTDGSAVNCGSGRSIPTDVTGRDAWIWELKQNSTDGYRIYNVSAEKYLGGQTSTGGAFTLGTAESANSFKCYYNSGATIKFKDYTNNLWIDRATVSGFGQPYAHTSGQQITFLRMYKVTFTEAITVNSVDDVTTIYVKEDGSDSFTLPNDKLYSINGAEAVGYADAEAAIAACTSNLIVTVSENTAKDVTYILKWSDGTTINAGVNVTTELLNPSSDYVPSAFTNDFTTLSYSPETITKETDEVTVTATWNGPFQISDSYASANWQVVQMHAHSIYSTEKWSWSYKSDDSNKVKPEQVLEYDAVTTNRLFCFVGNPYDGFKIYNAAAGSGYTLTRSGESDEISMATGDHIFTLHASAANPNKSKYFCLKPSGATNYVNFDYNNKKITGWADADNGSTCWVVAPGQYYLDFIDGLYLDAPVGAVGTRAYFQTVANVETVKSNIRGYRTTVAANMYSNELGSLNTYLNPVKSTDVITLTNGYYRVVSAVPGFNHTAAWYYNPSNDATHITWARAATTTEHQVNSIFKFECSDESWTIYSPNAQQYITTGNGTWNAQNAELGDAAVVEVESIDYAQYTLKQTNNAQTLHAQGHSDGTGNSGNLVTWNANTPGTASAWYIVETKDLVIPLNNGGDGNYYATLCVPFDVTIGNAAIAYTLEKSGNYLVSTEIEGNEVPAGTPVLLKGTNSTATATINTGSAFNDGSSLDCALTGIYVTTSVDATTNYVFGKFNGKVGFYHVDNNEFSLKANRAYLIKATTDQARGFSLMFDDEATGIVTPSVDTERESTIYNLSGQRLNKVQKGINIVNGKKVLF